MSVVVSLKDVVNELDAQIAPPFLSLLKKNCVGNPEVFKQNGRY
jgi:hypothetical protein